MMTEKPAAQLSAKAIFLKAIELKDHEQRREWLRQQCQSDAELLQKVELLLRAAGTKSIVSPLDEMANAMGVEKTVLTAELEPSPDATTKPLPAKLERQQIGPYKLLEQIGQGGFGTVYMAEQTSPVKRKVALKVLKPGMDSNEVIARFEAERQALAMMDHPNIARVLDGGTTEQGRPFFVMELVRGVPVTEFCDEVRATTEERLALFVDICRAVQHAHQKGIIHRDLKPSNVLVTMHDDKPVPKVIDFGIAKALSQQLTDRTLFTGYQQMLGTPAYMSPEQAQMSGIDIDTRSDVYSLGVLLYELLTGTTPFDKSSMNQISFDDLRKMIREQEPPRPSARITTMEANLRSTMADRRRIDQRRVSEQLRGELDWVVMKALEKDRNRRYESASALAADVQRFLNNEQVQACPPSTLYRLRKLARRHKGLLTTAGLLTVTLLIATGVSVAFAVQAEAARSEANGEKNKAVAAEGQAVAARKKSEKDLNAALDAIDKLLTHASSPELVELPAAQIARKKILEDVLAFYQKFQTSSGDTPTVQYRAALTWGMLGSLARDLGNHAQSRECHRQAIKILTPLAQEHPDAWWYDEPRFAAMLALGHLDLYVDQDHDAARRQFEQVRDWADILAKLDAPDRDKEFQRLIILKQVQSREGLATLAAISGDRTTLKVLTEETDRLLESLPAVQGTGDERHRVRIAINFANTMTETDPERADQYFRKAVAGAREALEQDTTRFGKSWNAQVLLTAGTFFQQRDSDFARELMAQSEQILTRLSDDFPEISEYRQRRDALRSQRIELLVQRGDYSDAAEIQDRLPLPEAPRDCWRIATLYERAGRDADADRFFELALQCALEQAPPMLDVRYWLRDLAFGRTPGPHARPKLAAKWADAAAEKFTADSVLEVTLGIVAYRNQQYDSAIMHCNRGMDLDPANDEAYAVRSAVYAKQGKYDEALAGYAESLERNPLNAWSWCDRGTILMDQFQRNREALADFDRAIGIEPVPHFYRKRATAHLHLQDYDAAQADLDVVLKSAEADMTAAGQAALLALTRDDQPQYRDICRRMLEKFGKSTTPDDNSFLAWTCSLAPQAIDDYAAAVKLAEQAFAANTPARRWDLGALGAILLRSGNAERALQVLADAAQQPASEKTLAAYVVYFEALALQQLGRSEEAAAKLKDANALADRELSHTDAPPAWNRRQTLELLRKETEELIEPSDGPPPN